MCLGSGPLKTDVNGMGIRACGGCQVCFPSVLQMNSFLRPVWSMNGGGGGVGWATQENCFGKGQQYTEVLTTQQRKVSYTGTLRLGRAVSYELSSLEVDWPGPGEHQFARTHASS